jgi:hypothetical protein
MIYMCKYITAVWLTAGGSSTSHIYTKKVHIIQRKENRKVRAVSCLWNYTLAFVLQQRKKDEKHSIIVAHYKNNEGK